MLNIELRFICRAKEEIFNLLKLLSSALVVGPQKKTLTGHHCNISCHTIIIFYAP